MDFVRFGDKLLPERVKRMIAPVFHRSMRLANRIGIVDLSHLYGDHYYLKRRSDPWRSDARAVANALHDEFKPQSVIDFGCAIGTHLEYFYEKGVEIRGLEAADVAFEHAVIPTETMVNHDLREPYQTEKQYDLAICFEVAEHIPEQYTETLVDTICSAADSIVFTAAPPDQGGLHHVNEQEREYWIEIFEKRGYRYDEERLSRLRERIDVEHTTWIPENLFVFTAQSRACMVQH